MLGRERVDRNWWRDWGVKGSFLEGVFVRGGVANWGFCYGYISINRIFFYYIYNHQYYYNHINIYSTS